MAKKMRSLRLSERTWNQLDELTRRFQVDNKTAVVEILAEREYAKMGFWSDLHAKFLEIGHQIDAVDAELESKFGGIPATDERATNDEHRQLSQKLIDLMQCEDNLRQATAAAQRAENATGDYDK
jgi:hypothetical protein